MDLRYFWARIRGLGIMIICKEGMRRWLRGRRRSERSLGERDSHVATITGEPVSLTQSSITRRQSEGQTSREYRYHRTIIRQQRFGLSVRLVLGTLRPMSVYDYQPP